MRKRDYIILTRELKRRILAPINADMLSKHWQENAAQIESDAFQAASLARYLAEHLSIDKREFLLACGLKC